MSHDYYIERIVEPPGIIEYLINIPFAETQEPENNTDDNPPGMNEVKSSE